MANGELDIIKLTPARASREAPPLKSEASSKNLTYRHLRATNVNRHHHGWPLSVNFIWTHNSRCQSQQQTPRDSHPQRLTPPQNLLHHHPKLHYPIEHPGRRERHHCRKSSDYGRLRRERGMLKFRRLISSSFVVEYGRIKRIDLRRCH